MAAGKERILRIQEEVEALNTQLANANSSLAAFKVRRKHRVLTGWAATLAQAHCTHLVQLCPRPLADPLQQSSCKPVAEFRHVS